MVGINAPSIAAQMIDFQAVRNGAYERFIGNAAHAHWLALNRGPTVRISVGIDRLLPIPALAGEAVIGALNAAFDVFTVFKEN